MLRHSLVLVVLIAIVIGFGITTSKGGSSPVTVSVTFDVCKDPICPDGTRQADIRAMVQKACDTVEKALTGLGKAKKKKPSDPGFRIPTDMHINTAVDNKDKLKKILKGALKRCKKGIQVECVKKCDDMTTAYVPHFLWYGDLHICLSNKERVLSFCQRGNSRKEGTILHEITHYGGSTDKTKDPISATCLEDILPDLAELAERH